MMTSERLAAAASSTALMVLVPVTLTAGSAYPPALHAATRASYCWPVTTPAGSVDAGANWVPWAESMRISCVLAPHAAPTSGSTERSRPPCSRPRARTAIASARSTDRRAVIGTTDWATTSVRLCVIAAGAVEPPPDDAGHHQLGAGVESIRCQEPVTTTETGTDSVTDSPATVAAGTGDVRIGDARQFERPPFVAAGQLGATRADC